MRNVFLGSGRHNHHGKASSQSRWARPRRAALAPLSLVAALLVTVSCSGATGDSPPKAAPDPSPATPPEITLAFAGDVHFAGRTLSLLDDPVTAFGPIAEELSQADVAVANLETAVTEAGTPEPKQFHFRAPPETYQAVNEAGIDAVSLANNHALDYGRDGLADTLRHAEQAKTPVFGAGEDAAAAYAPWITEVDGVKIAMLGMSQISELADRWKAGGQQSGIAMAHNVRHAAKAVKAAKQQADVVVVFMHWGLEGQECPTEQMTALTTAFARAGATAVVGTHSHLLLGDGWLDDTYVAYGLGNFLWWRDNAFSNDTGVLRLTLRGAELTDAELRPARISATGQPLLATGRQADRIQEKFAGLRRCTGLEDGP
ncbi:MAG: CapA family protein [Micromonosporaceae bacterium]